MSIIAHRYLLYSVWRTRRKLINDWLYMYCISHNTTFYIIHLWNSILSYMVKACEPCSHGDPSHSLPPLCHGCPLHHCRIYYSLKASFSGLPTVYVINTVTNQLGWRKGLCWLTFCFADCSSLGKWRQELKQRLWRKAAYGLSPWLAKLCFL